MPVREDFKERLKAVRASEEEQPVKLAGVYRNGQVLASGDDMSAWDNYDSYFKFYNISVDDPQSR